MASKGAGLAAIKASRAMAAREALLDYERYDVKKGDTVYAYAESSASGMTHFIRLYVPNVGEAGALSIQNITYYAGQALGWPVVDRQGRRYLKVSGGGMDMAFYAVYSLACVLFGSTEGNALRKESL